MKISGALILLVICLLSDIVDGYGGRIKCVDGVLRTTCKTYGVIKKCTHTCERGK